MRLKPIFFALPLLWLAPAAHAGMALLSLQVEGVEAGMPIPFEQARCIPTDKGGATNGKNIRPSVAWSPGPKGTKSYVFVMFDPDVPKDMSIAGRKGIAIGETSARQVLYHWMQANIPANVTSLAGSASEEEPSVGVFGTSEADPKGGVYGGPCPPPNDERIHRYYYTILALDVKSLDLDEGFEPAELEEELEGHIIGRGEVIGTYTLNPQATQ